MTNRLPTVVTETDFPCCVSMFCHTCCHLYPDETVRGVSRSLAGRRRPPRSTGGSALTLILSRPRRCSRVLRPVWPADPQKGPFPEVLQTIRRLLIRPGCFRLERELPGGICTHDINAPWQGAQWNKIEHRLFCHITQTWRGKPLTSRETVVDLIASTTTRTGLTVRCELDTRSYPKGIKVSDAEMTTLNIKGDTFHPEWNYTISPRAPI